MPTSRIGYNNIAEQAFRVSVVTENVNYPVENLANWNLYDFWKPNSGGTHIIELYNVSANTSVNYFGIASHNLGDSSTTVQLLSRLNSSDVWLAASSAVSINSGDNGVIFEVLDSTVTTRYFGLSLSNLTSNSQVGAISVGKTLDFPVGIGIGFSPPGLTHDNVYTNTISETGLPLGRSVRRQSGSTSIRLDLLDPDWVRSYLEPFLIHAETKPFFFSWDFENHPKESCFAWTKEKGLRSPVYSNTNLMSINLKLNTIV